MITTKMQIKRTRVN